MNNKNPFVNGITDYLILSVLENQDSYVYEIVDTISELSGGLISISRNTVYTAAYKLEREEKISEYSKLVGKKRTRIYYHIEPLGKEFLNELSFNYSQTIIGVQKIMSSLEQKSEKNKESKK